MDTAPLDRGRNHAHEKAAGTNNLVAQALRKRRLGMSFITYLATFLVVLLFAFQGLVPLPIAVHFLLFSLVVNGLIWACIHLNLNLKLRDPSMTMLQITLSQWPALWLMFFLEAGQARAIFLLITVVPLLYGILALKVRNFIQVSIIFLIQYCLLHLALWQWRPQVLEASLELVQLFVFIMVLAEVALIGGFISSLRDKVRQRNQELQDAMERIQELVNIDELTGVYNRRRIVQALSEESNRFRRTPGAFSLGIMDVDHFKEVNDTYGHQAGDEILRELAKTVVGELRAIDSFGRYGGEEFLLVLPQTALHGARIKSERLCKTIEGLRFKGLPADFSVTVSVGVAEAFPQEDTGETLARADRALYAAKENGRNQVVCCSAINPADLACPHGLED
ncbi:GGDEF domain-containing protein [Halopseudomonas salina]|uniref:diguanylate cyclase n=1 Tax=Halopseudomonas salina TaxID=1323744 RepID=A0ABQ1Q0U2_9GAMM|nr:GGDEF domain-containing protein [Halopseudomonas salina]GGD09793.1 GGDEF domain-containing protein [Halopseudomonas salina]